MSVRLGRGRLRDVSVAVGMLLTSLIGCVAVSIETAAVSVAQSAQTHIDIQGNRRVEADTIRSYFRVNGAERLDSAKIDAALKALYATGLFQDVRITPSNGRILVSVVENPVINKIAFEGNHKVKDEQLQGEIQSKARGTFSRALVQGDVQRIVDIYQHNGRYDVQVSPKVIDLPNGRVDLVYEINEGGKTGVEKIIFVGNNAFSDYRLKDVIKTGVTNWLSFLKSNDIFDADRIEVDRDLLRRFYLRNGFADVRVVSAVGEYNPESRGFIITFTIDEGPQYHFGAVNILSSVPAVPGEGLRYKLRVEQGRVYNADAIEKSVEEATIEVARMGYPFATVRPRGERNIAARLVDITFVVEEGQRVYVERINIKGNTRTRDYVIRREFDIVEGDPYNRALVDRAERRVKNLGYFKTVKITTEPGSAPDRIIVNCDVEEQSTGEFSFAGGYSTADGIIGEVSIGERNLMGTGDIAKASLQYGQRARGFDLSFVEPYLMGQRLALGTDIFFHQTTSSLYLSYLSKTYGGDIKLGIPIAENISAQARWTGYVQQITLPSVSANCNNTNPDFLSTFPTPDKVNTSPALTPPTGSTQVDCFADGEASIAVQKELAQGAVFVSAPGYTLAYNTLDNNKSPTNGLIVELKQDMAGAGGDVRNLKTTLDTRLYNEIFPDIVGMIRLQGGYATGWGGQDLRMLDHFQAGPNMVRGFAPAGFGPRDITQFGICAQSGGANPGVPCTNSQADALGGSIYWASSLEFQTPVPFAPKDFGMKLAWFADAGQLLDYRGPTSFVSPAVPAELQHLVNSGNGNIRSSVGMGLLWDSPFGPLRFDLAYALTKEPFDHTQIFRFGGGTRF